MSSTSDIFLQENLVGASPRHRKSKPSVVRTKLSWLGFIWAFISQLAMLCSCVGFFTPYWIEGRLPDGSWTSLGTFRRCNYPVLRIGGVIETVKECGHYAQFSDIPSIWWQASTIIIGIGCGLNILIAFIGLFACCLHDVLTRVVAKLWGVLQFTSGLCISTGCLLYALGWDSSEVRKSCGQEADVFKLGFCQLSWSLWLTVAGAGCTLLAATLSCSATKKFKEKLVVEGIKSGQNSFKPHE